MSKKYLSDRDICTKHITPAIKKAQWYIQSQIREEVFFPKGCIIVRGKFVTRGKAKCADYILSSNEYGCLFHVRTGQGELTKTEIAEVDSIGDSYV